MTSQPSGLQIAPLSIKCESAFDKEDYSPFIKMKERKNRRESAKQSMKEMLSKEKERSITNTKEKNSNSSKDKIKFTYTNHIVSPQASHQSIRESNQSIIGKLQEHHFTPFHSESFNLFEGIKLETNHKQTAIATAQGDGKNTDQNTDTIMKETASIPSLRSHSKDSLHNSITYFEYMSKMAQLKLKNQQRMEKLRELQERKDKLMVKKQQTEERRRGKLSQLKEDNNELISKRQQLQAEYVRVKKERHSLQQQYKHQLAIKKSAIEQQISKKTNLISAQHLHVQQLLNQITQTQKYILSPGEQSHPAVKEALQQFKAVEDRIIVDLSRYKSTEGVQHLWQVMDVQLTQLMHP